MRERSRSKFVSLEKLYERKMYLAESCATISANHPQKVIAWNPHGMRLRARYQEISK
jgi:hypothetical protein